MKKKKIIAWIMVALGGTGVTIGVIAMINYVTRPPLIIDGTEIRSGTLPLGVGVGFYSLPVLVLGFFYAIRGRLN